VSFVETLRLAPVHVDAWPQEGGLKGSRASAFVSFVDPLVSFVETLFLVPLHVDAWPQERGLKGSRPSAFASFVDMVVSFVETLDASGEGRLCGLQIKFISTG
jgi:hypothetical protein